MNTKSAGIAKATLVAKSEIKNVVVRTRALKPTYIEAEAASQISRMNSQIPEVERERIYSFLFETPEGLLSEQAKAKGAASLGALLSGSEWRKYSSGHYLFDEPTLSEPKDWNAAKTDDRWGGDFGVDVLGFLQDVAGQSMGAFKTVVTLRGHALKRPLVNNSINSNYRSQLKEFLGGISFLGRTSLQEPTLAAHYAANLISLSRRALVLNNPDRAEDIYLPTAVKIDTRTRLQKLKGAFAKRIAEPKERKVESVAEARAVLREHAGLPARSNKELPNYLELPQIQALNLQNLVSAIQSNVDVIEVRKAGFDLEMFYRDYFLKMKDDFTHAAITGSAFKRTQASRLKSYRDETRQFIHKNVALLNNESPSTIALATVRISSSTREAQQKLNQVQVDVQTVSEISDQLNKQLRRLKDWADSERSVLPALTEKLMEEDLKEIEDIVSILSDTNSESLTSMLADLEACQASLRQVRITLATITRSGDPAVIAKAISVLQRVEVALGQ